MVALRWLLHCPKCRAGAAVKNGVVTTIRNQVVIVFHILSVILISRIFYKRQIKNLKYIPKLLPAEYGYRNSVYRRFEDWSDQGIWKRMFQYFSRDKDMEWLMIDSTIVRAHACASGGKGGQKFRQWGEVRAAIAAKYT